MKFIVFFILITSSLNLWAKRRVVLDEKTIQGIKSMEKVTKKNVSKKTQSKNVKKKIKNRRIYRPAPVVDNESNQGYIIERDSPKIVSKKMSQNDTLNVKVCYSSGVSIALDESYRDTFQRIIINEEEKFEASPFENKRGVFVRLKSPVGKNTVYESAIHMVTQSNDKTFLINLLGVPCPKIGPNPFPKVYYIEERTKLLHEHSKVLTPEDTIIYSSYGYPRVNKYGVRIYDMVAAANSDWVFFGVEIQYPDKNQEDSHIEMKVLDNLQVNKIKSKVELLELSSKTATKAYGVSTMRFKLGVNIDKKYLLDRRYIYLMIVDKYTKHYQYIEIDLMQYYESLRKRDFNI